MKARLMQGIMRSISEKVFQLARDLLLLIKRPILLLDSSLCQMDWIGISDNSFQIAGLRRAQPVLHKRIILTDDNSYEQINCLDWPNIVYRGVLLSDAILYSVCVELEIASYELSIQNPSHIVSISKWLKIAKKACDEIIEIIENLKPKHIVVVQGYFLEASISRQLACRYRVNIIALENTFHNDRIICETVSGVSVNKTIAGAWHERSKYKRRILKNKQKSTIELSRKRDLLAHPKSSDHKSPDKIYKWKPKAGKRILFMAQCYTDSSLLFADTASYSTIEIISSLKDYAVANQVQLLIKLHPKEFGGLNPLLAPFNSLTMRKLRASSILDSSSPYLEIDDKNEYSSLDLIKSSDVVVTINSQAGLEALALGKEVITCGVAFYDFLRCSWLISDTRLLPPTLDLILKHHKYLNHIEKTQHFIETYLEHYCVARNASSVLNCILDRSPSSS